MLGPSEKWGSFRRGRGSSARVKHKPIKNFVITLTTYDWLRINLKKKRRDGIRCLPNVERRSRELGRHIIIVVVGGFAHLEHDLTTTTTGTGRILYSVFAEHGLDDTELKRCPSLNTVSPRRSDEMRRRYGDVPVGKTDEKPHRSSRIRDDVNPEIVHMTKNSTSSPNNTALIHPRGGGWGVPVVFGYARGGKTYV